MAEGIEHLQRATLDVSKILWLETKKKIDQVYSDEEIKRYCVNCSEADFAKLYSMAITYAQKARQLELKSVGINPTKSIKAYYRATAILKEALGYIDDSKLVSFKKYKFLYRAKEYAIGFVLGVIASFVASLFFENLKNFSQPKAPTPKS